MPDELQVNLQGKPLDAREQESQPETGTEGVVVARDRDLQKERYYRRLRILLPFLLVLVCLVYSFAAMYVPSESMAPTMRAGDYIAVMRSWLAYPNGRLPARGDIVTFEAPPNIGDGQEMSDSLAEPQVANAATGSLSGRRQIGVFRTTRPILVKRVVGLPGETIELRGRVVLVNGRQIDWPYRIFPTPIYSDIGYFGVEAPLKLADDELFVIGDNADNSDDSRMWGPLNRGAVRGKVVGVLYHAKASPDSIPRFR
jgi:signal peptidase I